MAQEDLLHREDFVNMLDALISRKVDKLEGCSIAIDGKWGCGKSYILRDLEKQLRGKGYFVVHYNCWQNDYYDEPLVAIMSVLIDSLCELNESSETTREQRIAKTKTIAIELIKKLSLMVVKNKLGVDIEKLGADFDSLKGCLSSALDEDKASLLSKQFDNNQVLKSSVSVIYEILLKIKLERKGVVFVVDELDRCLPEYAIKVLERLHHVCYDTENDQFQFVQLIAMNKTELNDGISKAYGRGNVFSTNPLNSSSFEIEGSSTFGSYYLQKFIQMVIPVPSEKPVDSAMSLLKGLEKSFEDGDMEQIQLVNDFLTYGILNVSMRVKQEMIELAKTVHQITMDLNSKTLAIPSLPILCVELLDCFCLAICKHSLPKVSHHTKFYNEMGLENQVKEPDEGSISLVLDSKDEYSSSKDNVKENIFDLFKTHYRLSVEPQKESHTSVVAKMKMSSIVDAFQEPRTFTYSMDNSKARVLWFYMEEESKYQPEDGVLPPKEDIDFVNAFRITLNTLS